METLEDSFNAFNQNPVTTLLHLRLLNPLALENSTLAERGVHDPATYKVSALDDSNGIRLLSQSQ